MLGYVTLGTNDLAKSGKFYDSLFETIGGSRFMEQPGYFIAWKRADTESSLGVTVPFDGESATVGNGVMVALAMESPKQVNAFYNAALELGATCEGKPGFRPEDANKGFYAGYFRDLDGNKLNAFCIVE
ncbi:VOC family protein [Aliiglaciecola sp. 3_MG-2023]|uniref:VOC family protein n=1 Tax=Aliiglaciecola sp. 3_MG-2023 TaxID=3062644 RepID=UPI0026E128AA|nr:VOC family protein [Aliiglaciecola sp. 3_MG-2023]MDO6694816.1 VOC family protein [Aliiglaciecola sp. 3_MG-2023]